MKTYNFAIHLGRPGDVALIMCCFSVPDSVSFENISEFFSKSLIASVEAGKKIGCTDTTEVIGNAMKMADEHFGGTSFIMQADAICFMNAE